jgi:methylated-DNA-protein-cysteine methyltransferase related protein
VIAVVRAIPEAAVMSYAGVARRAGLPRQARFVARVLAGSDDPGLPWHRVLRADGRIAFAADSPRWCEQRDRLLREGVCVRNGRVRLPPSPEGANLDATLWGPG